MGFDFDQGVLAGAQCPHIGGVDLEEGDVFREDIAEFESGPILCFEPLIELFVELLMEFVDALNAAKNTVELLGINVELLNHDILAVAGQELQHFAVFLLGSQQFGENLVAFAVGLLPFLDVLPVLVFRQHE